MSFPIKAFLSLLLLLTTTLFSFDSLESNYFVKKRTILLSDIIPSPQNDQAIYQISMDKYTKRVRTRELIKKLHELGYKKISSKHAYTQFTLTSPISLTKIEDFVRKKYQEIYPTIQIEKIIISPRSYRKSLPKHYTIGLNKRFYLRRDGTLFIKTEDNKKIFFNYLLRAKLPLLQAKEELRRGDELSNLNIKRSTITFTKFRSLPLLDLKKSTYEAKRKIKKGTTLTIRDVMGLQLVRRGENISVTVRDQNIAISFIGKAQRSGRYGETIPVTTNSGKKINAIITGRKTAEIK